MLLYINLLPGETSALWISIDVPIGQPPGLYEGEIFVTAIKTDTESLTQSFTKSEKHQIYKDIRNCLDVVEPMYGTPLEEVAKRVKSASSSLRKVLLSPTFIECSAENGQVDMMDEDTLTNFSVRLKLNVTVWEFSLPVTPSLPAVFGVSFIYVYFKPLRKCNDGCFEN